MKIDPTVIASTLKSNGFEMQTRASEVVLLRQSARNESLVDVLEFVILGEKRNTLAISVASSLVRHIATQFRGLFVRDGWPEVCSDGDNGRMSFRTSEQMQNWLHHVGELAQERFERLHRERSPELMTATKEARVYADAVTNAALETFRTAGIQYHINHPLDGIPEEQAMMVRAMLRLPLVLSSEELRPVYELAGAAMVRFGGEATLREALGAPRSISAIHSLGSVPNELMWRIRLVVDKILTASGASGGKARRN